MQRLEVSGVVRPIYGTIGVKRLNAVSTSDSLDFGITLKNSASFVFLKLQNCLF